MALAFKCDGCKKFYDGDLHGELKLVVRKNLNRNDIDRGSTSKDLCRDCLIKITSAIQNLEKPMEK